MTGPSSQETRGAPGTATLIYYVDTTGRSAAYSNSNSSAHDLAEAGVREMMAILSRPENNALKPTLLPQTTSTYATGTVTWSGTLDEASQMWTLKATGRIKNPTGHRFRHSAHPDGSRARHAFVRPAAQQPGLELRVLDTNGTPGGCDLTLNNNVSGGSRLYVTGNLCLNNNVSVTSNPLVVKGALSLGANAAVGTPTSMASRVETYVGGSNSVYCKYGNQSWSPSNGHPSCSDWDHVYSKLPDGQTIGVTTSTNQIPQIAAPVVDWDGWYQGSIPGPAIDCNALFGQKVGTTPVWDNNGLRDPSTNGSVASVFDLTPIPPTPAASALLAFHSDACPGPRTTAKTPRSAPSIRAGSSAGIRSPRP